MKKHKEYVGAREKLSHWQGQTPDIWNKLVLECRDGCFQTQRIPTDPWQDPALGKADLAAGSLSQQWVVDFAGVPEHTHVSAQEGGAALAQGAAMGRQMQLQTSSEHSGLWGEEQAAFSSPLAQTLLLCFFTKTTHP